MAISPNQMPTIYRNLYENTAPGSEQSPCSEQNFVVAPIPMYKHNQCCDVAIFMSESDLVHFFSNGFSCF